MAAELGRFSTRWHVDCVLRMSDLGAPGTPGPRVALALYELVDEVTQQRVGQVQIVEVVDHGPDDGPGVRFRLSAELANLPAVADLSFSPGWDRIAAALDTSSVAVLQYIDERSGGGRDAALVSVGQASLSRGVCLSAQWSRNTNRIAVSLSDGRLVRVDAGTLQPVLDLQAHSDSCWWASTLDCNDGATGIPGAADLVWTCGDDGLLCAWDERAPVTGVGSAPAAASPVHRLRHDVGVTHVAAGCSHSQYHILSGSFDERLRVWDMRSLRRPLLTHPMSGGVWRIRPHPVRQDLVAVACMHGGAAVVRQVRVCTGADDVGAMESSVRCTFTAHQSLCYGIDWIRDDVLVSCSFYNNLVCAWQAAL